MIVGFFVFLALLAGVAIDASAAYLRSESLDDLADGAALAAADGVQGDQVYQGGLGSRARIDPDAARGYVQRYLDQVGARVKYPGLHLDVSADGTSVAVRLTTPMSLPVAPFGWGSGTAVTGQSSVVVRVR